MTLPKSLLDRRKALSANEQRFILAGWKYLLNVRREPVWFPT